MAKLIKKKLVFSMDLFTFDFRFKDGLTIIGGDSSTGKTLFFSMLQAHSLLVKDNSYVFIDYTNMNNIREAMRVKGKVIVIDNADILLNAELVKLIKNDKSNQYILFGRNSRLLLPEKRNLAIITEIDRIFSLYFLYLD